LPASAYTPADPKVQGMVAKARKYLSGVDPGAMGGSSLIALAMVKSGSDESDPKVQQAIAAIRGALPDQRRMGTPLNYHLAISIIFLCEAPNAGQLRAETQALLDILLSRQEPHGGWSYWPGESNHGRDHGDSSMTQYGTLALWEAKRAGFQVPQEAAQRVANFWMGTQTPQGAWGYQAEVRAPGQRGPQEAVRPSIAMAGLSSCYVIGDLFGMAQRREEPKSNQSAVLQKVQEPQADARNFPSAAINVELMRQTMQLGERYIDSVHSYNQDTWIVYYMYAMERFRSFQEHYTGAVSAQWYDDGVEFLAKSQLPEGNWRYHMGEYVDTAFAILFLSRSTKKTIEREFGLGLVRGGRGLPSDISMIAIDEKTGNVINPELAGTIETLMKILEDPKNANFGALTANPEKFVEALVRPKQDEDQVAREQRIARLKEMVSKGDYQQRRFAVKALARTGDMDKAPLLLYALTDGDPRVRWEADAGLRFLSRKLNGFGPADTDKKEDLEKLRLQWRQWYLGIRPNAELID
jgi:hypothetical protein